MQYAWIEKGYMVYLEKGEKKIPSLIRFCAANVICNAQLTKLGASQSIEINANGTEKKNISGRKIIIGFVY